MDARTVRLWEKQEGLPVHRHLHRVRGSVYAFKSELDVWLTNRQPVHLWQVKRIMLAIPAFRNLGSDLEQESFADGLAEEVITQLSHVSSDRLRIVDCTSMMNVKDSEASRQSAGIDFILNGSIRRSGNCLRLTARLVDVHDRTCSWAESYEREVSDAVAMQSDIARHIARCVKVKLLPTLGPVLPPAVTANRLCHEAYLKGKYFWSKRTRDDLQKAINYFKQSIQYDSGDARAYSGLADSYIVSGFYGWLPTAEVATKARAAALRAVELDETLAEAHTSLGEVKASYDWDWIGAEKEYRAGIELDPGYVTAYQWYANFLALMRRPEAIEVGQQSVELDPTSPVVNVWMGVIYYLNGQCNKTIEQCEKALEIDPGYAVAYSMLGAAYEEMALYDKAIEQFGKAVKCSGESTWMLTCLARAYAVSGRRAEALGALRYLKALSTHECGSPYGLATVYAGMSRTEDAFRWLQQAHKDRSPWLGLLRVEPRMKNLRSDSRYDDLLRQVGLA